MDLQFWNAAACTKQNQKKAKTKKTWRRVFGLELKGVLLFSLSFFFGVCKRKTKNIVFVLFFILWK